MFLSHKYNFLCFIVHLSTIYIFAIAADLMITAPNPIILSLKRYYVSGHNVTDPVDEKNLQPIRSKPELFVRALGLVPGKSFQFEYRRWLSLKNSHLFKNLTAKSVVEDNRVKLDISGIELPSIRFTPEVSATASLERPEIVGGVNFLNSNLFGLGHQLEAIFSKKEGKEPGTEDLAPVIKVKFAECTLGSSSQFSFGAEQDESFQYVTDIVPMFHNIRLKRNEDPSSGSSSSSRGEMYSYRRSYSVRTSCMMKKIWVNIAGWSISNPNPVAKPMPPPVPPDAITATTTTKTVNHNLLNTMLTSVANGLQAEYLRLDVQPYFSTMSAPLSPGTIHVNGLLSTVTAVGKLGYNLKVTVDEGLSRLFYSSSPFKSLKCQLQLPSLTWRIPKLKDLPLSLRLKLSAADVLDGGAIPLNHMVRVGDSGFLRGSSGSLGALPEPRAKKYFAMQSDLNVGRHLGLFFDAGLHCRDEGNIELGQPQSHYSTGYFIRGKGLRCDVGWLLNKLKTGVNNPRLHFSLDFNI